MRVPIVYKSVLFSTLAHKNEHFLLFYFRSCTRAIKNEKSKNIKNKKKKKPYRDDSHAGFGKCLIGIRYRNVVGNYIYIIITIIRLSNRTVLFRFSAVLTASVWSFRYEVDYNNIIIIRSV